jgi:transcriptional regulator with XRE-family HTH domain
MPKASSSLKPQALYKSYNFIDKDPIIHQIERLIDDTGISYAEIERRSGVTRMCLNNWFTGKTRRPQHCTIMAVLKAIGYEYKIVAREAVRPLSSHRGRSTAPAHHAHH